MLSLRYERRIFVQENKIHDYIIYEFKNDSEKEIKISPCQFGFFEISPTDCVAWDGVEPVISKAEIHREDDSQFPKFSIWVYPDGVVLSNKPRHIGVRLEYENTDVYNSDMCSFRDRIRLRREDFPDIDKIEIFAAVIFPENDCIRRITATNGTMVSTRVAEWKRELDSGSIELDLSAVANRTDECSSVALYTIDDAIAEIHEVIALAATENICDLDKVRDKIGDRLSYYPESQWEPVARKIEEANTCIESNISDSQVCRQGPLRKILNILESARKDVARRNAGKSRNSNTTIVLGDHNVSTTNVNNSNIGGNVGTSMGGDAGTGNTSQSNFEAGQNLSVAGHANSTVSPPETPMKSGNSKWLTTERVMLVGSILAALGVLGAALINKMPAEKAKNIFDWIFGP